MSGRSYLSIGDVLSLLREEFPDVTISKIRFLERQGLVDPERSPSGYRKFYDDDVARLRWVLRKQRDQFLPLKVIRDRLAAAGNGVPADDEPADAGGLTPGAAAGGEDWHAGGASLVGRGADEDAASLGAEGQGVHAATGSGGQVSNGSAETSGAAEGADGSSSAGTRESKTSAGRSPAPPGHEPLSGQPARERAATATGVVEGHQGVLSSAPGPQEHGASEHGASEHGVRQHAVSEHAVSGHAASEHAVRQHGVEQHAVGQHVDAEHGGEQHAIEQPGGEQHGGPPSGRPAHASGSVGDDRPVRGGGHVPSTPGIVGAARVLAPSLSSVSLTLAELCAATGLTPEAVASLEGFGLLAPMSVAGGTYYDEEALTVGKLVVEFSRYGIEPRHLRMYRNAADREIGLVEQVITPLLRQRNPEARQRAVDAAADLAGLGQAIRSSLVRSELRRKLGG